MAASAGAAVEEKMIILLSYRLGWATRFSTARTLGFTFGIN
jgi:hypothetical protein